MPQKWIPWDFLNFLELKQKGFDMFYELTNK